MTETYESRAIGLAVHTHIMKDILGYVDPFVLSEELQLLAGKCEWLVYDEATLRKIHGD